LSKSAFVICVSPFPELQDSSGCWRDSDGRASDQKDQESEKSKISENVRPLGFEPPENQAALLSFSGGEPLPVFIA
jgi:hypothetical protein